jgi:thioredoxin reductase (NADPH)
MSGVFAVGDVRSGSIKQVGRAIEERAGIVAMIHQYLSAMRQGSRAEAA